jgi:hypothetical protein
MSFKWSGLHLQLNCGRECALNILALGEQDYGGCVRYSFFLSKQKSRLGGVSHTSENVVEFIIGYERANYGGHIWTETKRQRVKWDGATHLQKICTVKLHHV